MATIAVLEPGVIANAQNEPTVAADSLGTLGSAAQTMAPRVIGAIFQP